MRGILEGEIDRGEQEGVSYDGVQEHRARDAIRSC